MSFFEFNCLLTSEGLPTNDPKEVQDKNGTVMPLGGLEYGHKGFGLALGNRGFIPMDCQAQEGARNPNS